MQMDDQTCLPANPFDCTQLHSMEAEQSVLGGVMLAPETGSLVINALTENDFYLPIHQNIFRGIAALVEKNATLDVVTLGTWFESNGTPELGDDWSYLIDLANNTPSAANLRGYVQIVQEMSLRRNLIYFAKKAIERTRAKDGADVSSLMSEISNEFAKIQPIHGKDFYSTKEMMHSWFDSLVECYETGNKFTGILTPWSALNSITRGLQPNTLYLLAARPNMGKSVAGLNISLSAAMAGKSVAFFSLEMSKEDCASRCVASLGEIAYTSLMNPVEALDPSNMCFSKINMVIKDVRDKKLFIDDTPSITVSQFEARARKKHYEDHLDMIVVDHIHDFKINPNEARFEFGKIVQAGKNLAKELHIPVLMLAQLNRNTSARNDHRPTLTDLRESGEIEQKADVILFLHREDYYDTPTKKTELQGVVELHVAKGRNIKTGDRIHLKNRFDQMRLDEWSGPLPDFTENTSVENKRFFTKPKVGLSHYRVNINE